MSELAVRQENSLKAIMRSDEIRSKFAEVIGDQNAGGYISSVLIAVSESAALQRCTPASIISSALRAATMRLSVEPSTGQAFLVPFRDKATLIVGWRGIYHMALRTGKYRFINLFPVYEGEVVEENRLTGIHDFKGGKTSDTVIGYMLYFELLSGFRKTFYMTVEECIAHGARYSKTFNRDDSVWKTDPQAMYKKTVMRLGLTRWGYLEPSDLQNMNTVDESEDLEDVVDSIEIKPELPIPVDQAMDELGFGDAPSAEILDGEEVGAEEIQGELIQSEPPKIEPSDFWKLIKITMKKDQKYGDDLLEKNGGDFEAAYYEAKKLRAK
jgi:recombination protein RecT